MESHKMSKRTIKEIISDSVERELKDMPLDTLSVEKLKNMVENKERFLKKRYGICYPIYKMVYSLYMKLKYREYLK